MAPSWLKQKLQLRALLPRYILARLNSGKSSSPPESSDPRQHPPHLSTTIIPDLTDKIVPPGDQYCEAGSFGDVFRCRYESDDGIKEVAVKAFRFNFTVDERNEGEGKRARMIRRELGIWKRLSHRNVVSFLGIAYGFGRQGSASLVSMWMPHGTMHKFLKEHDNRLGVAHRLQLLLDIANGLQYLHSFPLVHGDLSSNNVLLDHNYNACLIDFGCASLVGDLPEGFTYLKMSSVRPGTLRWAAPEHFSINEGESKHTVKSDIHSFGNMALLILSGKYPWSEVRKDTAVVLRLSQGHKPGRPLARPIDNRHWALIEQCWSSIPQRPLAEGVVATLQQFLGTYPSPPPLGDLLDSPTPSYNGSGYNKNAVVTRVDPPLGRTRAHAPSHTLGGQRLLGSVLIEEADHEVGIGEGPFGADATDRSRPSTPLEEVIGTMGAEENGGWPARARHSFDDAGAGELPLTAGAEVEVLDDRDNAWWYARNPRTGQEGVVHASYLH